MKFDSKSFHNSIGLPDPTRRILAEDEMAFQATIGHPKTRQDHMKPENAVLEKTIVDNKQ